MKLSAILMATAVAVAPVAAHAAGPGTVAYMTGSSDPFGLAATDPGSPEHAMLLIYGPGGYDRFQGFDNAIFDAGYTAIYMEGSDVASSEFLATYDASAATAYVAAGGRLYVNAAISDWGQLSEFAVANGIRLKPGTSTSADSIWHSDNGAGFAWTGTPFAAGIIDDSDISIIGAFAPISGDAGRVYGWYFDDSSFGYLFVGTMTAPALHSAEGGRLRTNLTCLWNGGPDEVCGTVIPPIPEPATWAMMIAGFGLVGAAARRQRRLSA